MTPQELITEGRKWLNIPFRHQGRSRLGVDCVGYLEVLLREADALPPGYVAPIDYGRLPSGQLEEVLDRYCFRTDRIEPGALAAMQWPAHKHLSHVGLITGPNLLHCYQAAGRVVEHGYQQPWLRMTRRIYRLPGVTYE